MIVELFAAAGALCLARLLLGPTFADRLLAADALTSIVVFLMAFYSVVLKNPLYIDVALVFAMLSFVGTLAIAKWVKPYRRRASP